MKNQNIACSFVNILLAAVVMSPFVVRAEDPDAGVAVGPQYDSTHVYLAARDFDAFVRSFTATFGGKPSKRIVANVLPVPSSTQFQYVWSQVGTLSIFAFTTPIPFPFGSERTGYLVTDMNQAINAARDAGAEVIVEPFKDAIGVDAVIQFPGGVKTQLYWHFTAPKYDPLESIPDNRVYLSRDRADDFVHSFLRFSHGKITADETKADAGEIGRAGETYRRIDIESRFGKMRVLLTDGHLPYPFGRELMGYQVADLNATWKKPKPLAQKFFSSLTDRTIAAQQSSNFLAATSLKFTALR